MSPYPKPIQTPAPPIMSAGGSEQGRRFAAQYADLCFMLLRSDDPEAVRVDVDAYRDLARREYAREIQMWTVAYVIQRDSQEEADAYEKRVIDNADRGANDATMSMLGAQSKMMSAEAFLAFKNRYIAGAGGFPLVGTAERIADRCARLSAAGVDGVLLCWIVFSGRGMPPQILASSAEVKKFVAADPYVIGYIEKSAADSSVKVVLSLP
ncbi:MAG: LLM class flavin-dependent oxidoreductase [Pseudomonadota bacterium]|nr:LLM class flavin-dependent oxidoreductase [Pseudomonadota bacterium]